jgi:hypothetical protein
MTSFCAKAPNLKIARYISTLIGRQGTFEGIGTVFTSENQAAFPTQ